MKRLLSMALVLSMLLAMCLSGTALAAENTTLTLYYWDEGQKSGMDAMIELFENKFPNIKVETTIIPWGQYWMKLQTSLPSGTGPDLFWMNMYAPEYIESGLIYDITDLVKKDGVDLSKFPATVTSMYTMNDHIYGIPKDFDSIALWYNKGIFDEMGVPYPSGDWTWDDLLATAQKLTNENHYGFIASSSENEGTNNFIFQNGGQIVSADHKTSMANEKENVEALQFMHDLMYKYKVAPTGSELSEMSASDTFVSGQAAMVTAGSWNVSTFFTALGDKLGVTQLPMKAQKGTTTHGVAICMSAKTPNVDAAWEFLKFSATEEAQLATAQVVIPAYDGAAKVWVDTYPSLDLQVFVDALAYSQPNAMYIKKQSEAAQIYDDAVAAIWLDENADIQSIMDDAQSKIQAVISQ